MTAASHVESILVALIGMFGLVLTVTLPLWIGQRHLHQQAERTFDHLNHVEDELGSDGDVTLGQRVARIGNRQTDMQLEATDHYARNAHQHQEIIGQVIAQGERLDHVVEVLSDHIETETPVLDRLQDVVMWVGEPHEHPDPA